MSNVFSSDMNLQVTEMENNNRRPKLMFEKYTWKINHFSKLNPEEELLSDKFRLNDFTWYIVICPPGDIHDYLQIYLEADKDCANLPKDWKKIANFNLTLINQVNDRWSVRKGFEFEFSADDYYDGRSNFLSFREFNKPGSGFIVNDTCVVEAGIFVTKYVYVNDEYQSVFKIDDNPPKDNDNSSFHEMFIHSFKNIEQTLIPRLERVCLYVPSLVVSQEKRSFRFTEWAFTTLGQILHFMGTKKLKDMDDEACNHLQILWDTVNTFGFDLSWLEDDVEDALL
ncbi:MATH domain and coiled-coil domain-containing protein At2g01790-like isoform X1 [Vigna unguiculata]|uniref:MATH domain and coiled-coil domain-containing protein At2g01790-like isoform X1 n=1 Tax=Vigna unguiculata TaxID=3917 RepID=UPI001016E5B6|nr:MATH domain and coiled-coil domain-containing protein At2g01790-like isoform X1 [Vigna unguiculata]